ncbi:MAG: hypothetical protein IKD45_01405, partial [Clostridia bacterium]|nr:hypothetical protein [Clostridia bacterium]
QSGSAAIAKAMYAVLNNNSYKDGKWADGAKTAIILMRRDYTLYSYEYQDNLAQAQGEIIIDLNGYTLSESVTKTGTAASRNKSIFHATAKRYSGAKGNMVFPTTFTVKNGSIRVFGGSVLYMNTWQPDTASGYITDKVFTWNFENITFGLQKGANTANLITGNAAATASNKAELGCAPFRVNLYGCVVDLASVAPTSAITVFGNDHPANYYIDCDIKIYGSEIRANTLNNITITKLNAVNTSSITFEEYSGEHTSLSLASGVTYPSHSLIFKNEAGKEFTFTLDHTAGEYDIYKLMPSIETEYGFIPARYESAESYPFVVFRNGSFIIATNLFGKNAADSALHCAKSNGSVILMRRSFTYTESQYNNLSQTNGAITIDLGGFTLSCEQAGSNALLYAQKKTSYVSSVTVINGTILTAKNPIVRFASWAGSSGSYTGGSTFNIIFDGVTFGAVPGTSPEVLIAKSDENLPEPVTYGNLTVRGCKVELGSIKGTTLISAADASGRILLSARVENTLVYGDELGGITLARVAEGSSVIFGKDVKLYTKGSVTDEAVMTTSGEGRFVKIATDGEYDVYAIAKKELADFTVYASVSLYSDFVYNIYVPKGYNVTEITVGGKTVRLSDHETVTLEDGNEYYRVTYAIGVTDAAEEFKVIVTVNGARATYTMSIPDYASRVIADTDTTEEERTLMYSMLSYIKAAYVYEYGDGERADAAVALIGGIIGTEWETGESAAPDMQKPSRTPTVGISYATLNLGAKPALRLYIASGYAKEDITFGTGAGKEISYGKDTLGEYIDVTLYAYGMIDNLTFTVNDNGTEVEEAYNVYSYYEWATAEGNGESTPELVTLVERFVRYCESARAYRAAVLGK